MKKLARKFLAVVAALALPVCVAASDVTLSVESVARTGTTATYTGSLSISNTYLFINDGRVFLHVKNTGGSDTVLTIVTQATSQGYAIGDQAVTVTATTGDKFIGPFPASLFNDANEKVSFTLSATTGVTVAVLKL